MNLAQTENKGTTNDCPAREFHDNEHGESLNRRGGRGGYFYRGGRGRGGRSEENRDNDAEEPRTSWRSGPGGRRGGGRGAWGGGGGGRGGRGGRHYDPGNDDDWSSWRRGDTAEGNNNNYNNNNNNNNSNRGDNFQNDEADSRPMRGGGRGRRGGRYAPDRGDNNWAPSAEDRDDKPREYDARPRSRFDMEPYERAGRGRGRGGRPPRDDWEPRQNYNNRHQHHQRQHQQEEQEHQESSPQEEQPQEEQPQQEKPQPRMKQPKRETESSGGDAISTNPNRTQRAPNLRRNCFSEREVEELFERHHQQTGISLDNYANIPVDLVPRDVDPVENFADLFVEPGLATNILKCGYKQPTPVQQYGIPVCLSGADLMACAQTGSGKTAAFLVPVIHYILHNGVSPARRQVSYPIAVIMAPTRELALQIYDEVRKLTFRTDIFYDVVYGGTPYPTRFENDILVACPGRLKDIFDRNILSFSCVKFLVLDEADRMLEMGFEEQIEYLVASRYTDMPSTSDRQTLMFSATFPQRILNLAKRYLRQQYYLLTVGRVGSTTKNITQCLERVQDSEKMNKLIEIILLHKQTDLVLVFVETKLSADNLHYALKKQGIPSATIHGDRRQPDRERALRDFKDGITPILVATDVASRGLDIPNVMHVIQYDLPKDMDDYTHRIGRTGRAGNKGTATAFYNRNNRGLATELYSYLKEHEQDIPVWFEEEKDSADADRFLGGSRPRGGGWRNSGGDGGDRPRVVPERTNATWGESRSVRGGGGGGGGGRQGGGGGGRQQGVGGGVDDGGF